MIQAASPAGESTRAAAIVSGRVLMIQLYPASDSSYASSASRNACSSAVIGAASKSAGKGPWITWRPATSCGYMVASHPDAAPPMSPPNAKYRS